MQALLLTFALLAAGCGTTPPFEDASASAAPWEQGQPWQQAEPTLFYSAEVYLAMRDAGINPDQQQWYDVRRDQSRGVYAGQPLKQVYQKSVTRSHSSQGTSNGRSYENSYRHTYTREVEITSP